MSKLTSGHISDLECNISPCVLNALPVINTVLKGNLEVNKFYKNKIKSICSERY